MTPLIRQRMGQIAHGAFGLFLFLALGTHAYGGSEGPLSWGNWLQLPGAGVILAVGPLGLLPVLIGGLWLLSREKGWWRRLVWGDVWLTGLLAGVTLLAVISLIPHFSGRAFLGAALTAGTFWFVYLFILNERPALLWLFWGVLVLQSCVGIGQFLGQRDLGLRWLGEPWLDPQVSGINYVWFNGQRWLRSYGLTAHPSRYSTTLASLWLILYPAWSRLTGQKWWLWGAGLLLGVAGLLGGLSRSVWLAFGLGVALYTVPFWVQMWRTRQIPALSVTAKATAVGLTLLFTLFFTVYGGAMVGRLTNLRMSNEARSLSEHQRSDALSGQMMGENPWLGVGAGRYRQEGLRLDPTSTAPHNIPLAMGAEMGVLGFLLWLGVMGVPFVRAGAWQSRLPQTALWTAVCLISLFNPGPGLFNGLHAAILMGVIMAEVGKPIIV